MNPVPFLALFGIISFPVLLLAFGLLKQPDDYEPIEHVTGDEL